MHRLDKDTTGLLIVARNDVAREMLTEALAARAIEREYQAIAVGVMTSGGTVDAPIDRHPVDRVRMAVRTGGRDAITHYRVIERFRRHTWVRVMLETGRTHQIRLHLAHAGYPLVGDQVYGRRLEIPRGATPALAAALRDFRRQALHAAKLSFPHPADGRDDRGGGAAADGFPRADRSAAPRSHRGRFLMAAHEFLQPDWPAPANVRAAMTTRTGGVSSGRYASFNLATHVGDDLSAVAENRRRLRKALELPGEPHWLEQVHGAAVMVIPGRPPGPVDGVVSFTRGAVCAVLVADCLPVFIAGRDGKRVGLAHAGWRGLAAGVIEATIANLDCDPNAARRLAWAIDRSTGLRSRRRCPQCHHRRRPGSIGAFPHGPCGSILRGPAGAGAPPARRRGRHRRVRGRSLHGLGAGAVLFPPARREDRTNGRADLARVTWSSLSRCQRLH